MHAPSDELVIEGTTYFGFFSAEALADQVGIRDAEAHRAPRHRGGETTRRARCRPAPRIVGSAWSTESTLWCATADPTGLGFVRGSIDVDPSFWFFSAHFHGDPVWPGSLGIEAFLQLLKVFALDRWDLGASARFSTHPVDHPHRWIYRGQVTPDASTVSVEASIVEIDDESGRLVADGMLSVDGRPIYEMKRFGLEVRR